MTYTVTITSQGQISLPVKIRRELGFSQTNKALVSVEKGRVMIEPVKDFLAMRGSLKTNKKPLSNQALNARFAASIVGEYAKRKSK